MWLELQIFGFRALWSPYYLVFVIGLGIIYHLVTVTFRHKFTVEGPPSVRQYVYFVVALIFLYVIKGSPVDLLSHIMFTGHMVQMALYCLIFPILIIKGVPVWVWRKVFATPIIKNILNVLTKPLVALLLFNGLFSFYHVPIIFDFAKAHPITHAVITTIVLFAAFLMWWVVFCPIKERDKMSPLLKIGYIFANGVLITPACGLIIFATHSLYATYGEMGGWIQSLALCVPGSILDGLSLSGPEMFSPFSIEEDQQFGGILMKVTQEVIYSAVLASIFFGWFTKESSKIDPIPTTNPGETQPN